MTLFLGRVIFTTIGIAIGYGLFHLVLWLVRRVVRWRRMTRRFPHLRGKNLDNFAESVLGLRRLRWESDRKLRARCAEAMRYPSRRLGESDAELRARIARCFGLLLWLVTACGRPEAPSTVSAPSGCRARGLLPDPACTPGAVMTTDLDTICGTSTRGRRDVTAATRRAVFVEYDLSPKQAPGAFEVDHLIPLELGGSNALENLWPEAAPGFHDKDHVENELHRAVCSGAMPLADAQRRIASDWTLLHHPAGDERDQAAGH